MTKHRWQFSLRALLVVTAVVAVVVSVAVRMPPVLRLIAGVVCFLYVVIQALEFATSERRPILAGIFVGVVWIVVCRHWTVRGQYLWRCFMDGRNCVPAPNGRLLTNLFVPCRQSAFGHSSWKTD